MFITESCPHPPEYKKVPKTMKNLDRKQTPHSLDHPCCAAHPLDRSSWLCSAVLVQLLLLQLGFLGSTATLWCSVSLPKPSSSQKSCRLPSVAQQCLELSRASTGHSPAAALPEWCWVAAQSWPQYLTLSRVRQANSHF